MPRLPVVSWKELVKLLTKLGYTFKRQGKGDHIIYTIHDPRSGLGIVSIPRHNEIDPGTLRSILEIVSDHTGLTTNDLIEMLK